MREFFPIDRSVDEDLEHCAAPYSIRVSAFKHRLSGIIF